MAGDGRDDPQQPRLSPDTSCESRGNQLWDAPNLGSLSLAGCALLVGLALGAQAQAAPAPVRLRLVRPHGRRTLPGWLRQLSHPSSARRTESLRESDRAGRQVRVSPSSGHSGSVRSSGWDVLAKTVAAVAAQEEPEPSTPQRERKGWNRGPRERLE